MNINKKELIEFSERLLRVAKKGYVPPGKHVIPAEMIKELEHILEKDVENA